MKRTDLGSERQHADRLRCASARKATHADTSKEQRGIMAAVVSSRRRQPTRKVAR